MKTTSILHRSIATLLALAALPAHSAQQSITAAGDPLVNASIPAVRWATPANWSGPNGATIPTATDNAVITYGGAAAALIDIRASGFAPVGATAIEDLAFSGAGTGGVTLENNSTTASMVLTLNGARGTATPILQSGAYAVTIQSVGPATVQTLTLQLSASRAIDVGAGGLTIGATISQSGTQSITKTGAGRLVLSGANTFSGGSTVSAGVLEVTTNAALGTGPLAINGGTLEVNIAAATLTASSITVNAGGQLATRGTVTLSNPVTLNGGALGTRSTDGGIFAGAITVAAPSFVNLRSYNSPANSQSLTLSGLLSGGSSLTLNGNDPQTNGLDKALILTNPANTFSGGFTVSSAQILRNLPAASGRTIGTGTVSLSGGTLDLRDDGAASGGVIAYGNNVALSGSGGTLNVDHVTANTGNTFDLGALSIGTQTLSSTGGSGYLVRIVGPTTLTGTATFNPTTANTILGGVVSGGGTFDLVKIGSGTLQLNAANTYSGKTLVNEGTLLLKGSIPGSPRINIKTGATLDLTTTAGGFTLGASQILSGDGTVSGPATIASGGRIEAGDAAGTGTLSLSNLTLGTAAGHTATVVVSPSASTLPISVTALNGLVANGGPGKVAINIAGSNPTLGVHQLIAYTGTLGGGFGSFVLGTLPSPRLTAILQNSGSSIDLNVTGADAPFWSGKSGTQWSNAAIPNPKNWALNSGGGAATDFLTADSVNFDDSATPAAPTADISVNDVQPSAILFSNATKPYTVTGTKAIIGGTGLTKTGAARTTLANLNSFTGPVTVSGAGFLSINTIANTGAASALGAGSTLTLDDGTLEFTAAAGTSNRSLVLGPTGGTLATPSAATSLTLTGILSGTGLIKTGAGKVILTSALNTYTTTLISGGTLQIGDGTTNGTLGTGSPITDNATLAFNNPLTQTVAAEILGTGALTKTGAGVLVLSGGTANSYTGDTTVSGGNLILSKTSGLNAVGGNLIVAAGGTVSYGTTAGQLQDHIADTASITLVGGTFGSGAADLQTGPTPGITDTVLNVTVNTGTFLSGRNATVTPFKITDPGADPAKGILRILGGAVLAQRGGGIAADKVIFTGGTLSLDGGSTTPGQQSKLLIGIGGLTLSGTTIAFNAGPSTVTAGSVGSILTLAGNLTATGTSAFTRLSPTLSNAIVDLAAAVRTLDVTGTLTIAPDLGAATDLPAGGIHKTGSGQLILQGAQSYASLIQDSGRTDVLKTIGTGTSTIAANGGTLNLGVGSTLTSLDIANGAVVNVGLPFSAPAAGALAGEGGGGGLEGGSLDAAAVPEPGTAALLFGGMAIALSKMRRNRRD